MLKNDYPDQDCSVARTLEVVGERWTLLVVRELFLHGPRRFHELESALSIAKNVLTARLEKMVEREIVVRSALDDPRDWGVYSLTPKGLDLFPVLNAMLAWGDKHAAPHGAPIVLEHRCGGSAGHKLVCASCGEDLRLRDLRVARRARAEPAKAGRARKRTRAARS